MQCLVRFLLLSKHEGVHLDSATAAFGPRLVSQAADSKAGKIARVDTPLLGIIIPHANGALLGGLATGRHKLLGDDHLLARTHREPFLHPNVVDSRAAHDHVAELGCAQRALGRAFAEAKLILANLGAVGRRIVPERSAT